MRFGLFTVVLIVASGVWFGCAGSAPRFTLSKDRPPAAPGDATPAESSASYEEGMASYYADEFNGRKTSNGEIYDMNKFTAAHRTLPFNTKVRVTNVATGKWVVVRINDRGPFKDNRIIDLSLAAAKSLELIGNGTGKVQLQVVEAGDTVLQH
jgi:rare lipoprotein A